MAHRLRSSPHPAGRSRCARVSWAGRARSSTRQSSPEPALSQTRAWSTPAQVRLASFGQEAVPSLEGGVGWLNSGPIDLQQLRGKIVLAGLLDLLLHQLPPRPADPGQARREVQERAGDHRRPLREVQRRAGPREHPPQGRRVPDQASRRQRRQHGDLGAVRRLELADARADHAGRPGRRHEQRRDPVRGPRPRDRPGGREVQGPAQPQAARVPGRDGQGAVRLAPLPGQGAGRSRRAIACSSPTPATTGSSRPTSKASRPWRSARARKASSTATSTRPGSTGPRACAWTARRSTWPTPRTTPSGPWT